MAITIKTPQEIAQDFMDNLKALKPNLDPYQTDTDWWIKGQVIGGVVSGVYSDLNKVSNDAFPQSARMEAVDQHLQTWTGAGLRSAQVASGDISVSGTSTGITVFVGTQFVHEATQNVYTSTEEVTIAGLVGSIPVVSVVAGANQNLVAGTTLTVQSPPSGLLSTGTTLTGIGSGTDAETTEEGAARVLQLIRSQRRGATESDYIAWAFAADPSVKSVKLRRFPYGLGTVELIVAAGSDDIDEAVDNDLPISFLVSPTTAATVNTYVDSLNPVTDTVSTVAVTESPFDVEVDIKFVSGDQNTIVADAGVTQGQLVKREISRALYKAEIGGIIDPSNGLGYLYFTDLEEQIDANLHHELGAKYQIVLHRAITVIQSSIAVREQIGAAIKSIPGTITITEV